MNKIIQQQYDAVVKQNRDLQGELRVKDKMIELMATPIKYTDLEVISDYKQQALQELDQLTESEG